MAQPFHLSLLPQSVGSEEEPPVSELVSMRPTTDNFPQSLDGVTQENTHSGAKIAVSGVKAA